MLLRRCECTTHSLLDYQITMRISPPSVDHTGDLLMLIPLHDTAHTPTVPPQARATSPAPSQISAAAVSVLSSKMTSTAPSTTTADSIPPSPIKSLRLDTLFNIRRGHHVPLVSLTERKDGTQRAAPPAPAPVSLGPADWRSWLGGLVGSKAVTGDQIDALRTSLVFIFNILLALTRLDGLFGSGGTRQTRARKA